MKFTTMMLTVLVCICCLAQVSHAQASNCIYSYRSICSDCKEGPCYLTSGCTNYVHLAALAVRQDQVSRSSSGMASL